MSGIDLKKAWEAAAKPPEGWQGNLFFYNKLGQKIRYGHAPAIGDKKGTIVLTHGYGEHIDLYYETIKKYQKMGYEVWGMDWQGHGLSERDNPDDPLTPGTNGLLRQTQDLDFFVSNLVKTRHDPKTPLIMSTHSMGGHIGLLYLKKHPGVFDGAVMSAPMYDIYRLGMGHWARSSVKTLFNAASRIGLANTCVPTAEAISKSLGRLGRRFANIFNRPASMRGELRELVRELTPDAKLARPTFGWVAAAYKTIDTSLEEDFLKSIKTPILIGSAENEDLVDNEAHERAARLMKNVKHVMIANAHHGLWFENDGPFTEWWKNIESFVSKLKPLPPRERSNEKTVASKQDIAESLKGRTGGKNRDTEISDEAPSKGGLVPS